MTSIAQSLYSPQVTALTLTWVRLCLEGQLLFDRCQIRIMKLRACSRPSTASLVTANVDFLELSAAALVFYGLPGDVAHFDLPEINQLLMPFKAIPN